MRESQGSHRASGPGGGDEFQRATEAAAALTEFFANNPDVIQNDPLLRQVIWMEVDPQTGDPGGIIPGLWKGGGPYISVTFNPTRGRVILNDLLEALLALVGGDYTNEEHKKYAELHQKDPHLKRCLQFADVQIVVRPYQR
jgi:hypothetical protein